MSDKSGGFFSSMGRFFSGGSASKNKEADKSTSASSSSEDGVSNTSSRSPTASTAAPAAFLKDIISADNESSAASNEISVDTTQNSRIGSRLRYLSPSALDQRSSNTSNGLEIEVDAVPDIFFSTPSFSTSRKRQLTELDKQALPQSFRSDSVKRSRFLNRSLLEPTLKGTLNSEKRLDMSWSGELTANHSPASSITNFSLLSRRSGATTNGSLSTRTQEIFKRLEGANTPAKEVQRMSMLRAGLSRPERWALNESRDHDASSTATPPPPLKKAGDGIPSRIQLISKTMGMSARRTPYWTDLTRKRTASKNGDNGSSETSSLRSLNGTFASAELSSLFSSDPPAAKKNASSVSTASTATLNSSNNRKQHISILKGPDGKPVSRNTFKLSDDIDEEDEDSQKLPPLSEKMLSNPQPLKLAPESAPKRGFLDDLSFSFSAPQDVVSAVGTAKTISVASSNRSSESKGVESDSSAGSVEKQSSESSESDSEESDDTDVEVEDDNADEVKESRPQTSADTISTADGSNQSNQSSKDSSPKLSKDVEPTAPVATSVAPAAKASANWDCQSCFCSWDQALTKCGACGEPRPGTAAPAAQNPASKQLVSNLSSFAPAQCSSFKFGFGGGATTTAPVTSSALPVASKTVPFGNGASTAVEQPTSSIFAGVSKPIVPVAAPAVTSTGSVASTSSEGRVDWDCPDCMVHNKATDDKCPCCSHVKYASAESSSNVFGNRAFKPLTATTTAVQFGVGGSSSAKPPAFGFGASKPAEAPPTTASTVPVATSGFGISTKTLSAPTVSNTVPEPAKSTGSLFGNIVKPADSTAPNPAPAASVAPVPSTSSLFGNNTKSLFGAPKTASEPVKDASSQPSIFGSILNKETPTTTTTATSAPASSLAPASTPLFGSSTSSTPFGGSSIFGTAKPTSEIPKSSSTLSFGAPTSTTTNDAPKASIFGNIAAPSAPVQPAPTSSTSLFGSNSSSTNSLFSTKPADSTTPSIFGKKIQFSGEVGTTTTDGGAPAKRGLFSSDAPKLSFGGEQKVEPPKFGGFGASANSSSTAPTTTGSLFGNSSAAPMFGGPSNSVPAFTSSSSTTTSAFGSTTTVPFGGTTSTSGFGSFGSKTTQPGMSTSSSTNSLFSQGPADSSNPFGTANSNGFKFGGSSTSTTAAGGAGVFQFGSSAPAAPASNAAPGGAFQFGNNLTVPQGSAPNAAPGGAFQFGNNLTAPQAPAPGSMDNAFAYQPPSGLGGARKMAMARRRNIRK